MKYYNIPPLIVGASRSIKHKIRTSRKSNADVEVGDQSSTLHIFIKIYLCLYGMISELKAAFSLSFSFNDFHSDTAG